MYIDGVPAIADIKYFFQLQFGDTVHSLALVSIFSPPDQELLVLSHQAAYICRHGDLDVFMVVNVKNIYAVVAMVPDYQVTAESDIIILENMYCIHWLNHPFSS